MLGRLYGPTGKALEHAQKILKEKKVMACNIALGCSNRCTYCYGNTYRRYGLKPGEIRYPKEMPVKLIDKQIKKGLKPKAVFLSFLTDPFLKENEYSTESVIKHLLIRGIKVATLSKSGTSIFSNDVMTGMTICSYSDDFSKHYEPHAKPISERLTLLRNLSRNGHPVWISIEPYPPLFMFSQHSGEFFKQLGDIGPQFMIFGKLNYHSLKEDDRNFYKEVVHEFSEFCESRQIDYHIKEDTLKYIEGGR